MGKSGKKEEEENKVAKCHLAVSNCGKKVGVGSHGPLPRTVSSCSTKCQEVASWVENGKAGKLENRKMHSTWEKSGKKGKKRKIRWPSYELR